MKSNRMLCFVVLLVIFSEFSCVDCKWISFKDYFRKAQKANIIEVPCGPGRAKDPTGACRRIISGD